MSPHAKPDELVTSEDPLHPANLIPELCRGFYHLGWVTGTGGGISIRVVDKVYIAPSGVQKERILPSHIFVLPFPAPDGDRVFLRRPSLNLKESACTPLFWNAFDLRGAGSCIHTHSQNAVIVTLLTPGNMFRISHQEVKYSPRSDATDVSYKIQMIKGVRIGGMKTALSYLDTLEVPIIENTPNEEDLKDSMAEAMKQYPDAAGVLVRRHGIYVWGMARNLDKAASALTWHHRNAVTGSDWEKAKTQTECLDYLFEIAIKMKKLGLPLVQE